MPHFDYSAIAAAVDYVVIMAYSAASPTAVLPRATTGAQDGTQRSCWVAGDCALRNRDLLTADISGMATAVSVLCRQQLNSQAQSATTLTLSCAWLPGLDLRTLSIGLDNLLHRYNIPPGKIIVAFGWYGTDFLCAGAAHLAYMSCSWCYSAG